MAYVHFQKINRVQYLYGAIPYRPPGEKPKRHATYLGRINPDTHDIVLSNNFKGWMEKNGSILQKSIKDVADMKGITFNFHNIDQSILKLISVKACLFNTTTCVETQDTEPQDPARGDEHLDSSRKADIGSDSSNFLASVLELNQRLTYITEKLLEVNQTSTQIGARLVAISQAITQIEIQQVGASQTVTELSTQLAGVSQNLSELIALAHINQHLNKNEF
ncbi:MAG: hypothetical protein LBR80_00305 [Deltaproteobacteria bacterium]|nr:hypothetical protein [Deltaproteobacteria bacterium]